jgi:carbon monoxide dehydrogenase subunit G
MILDTPLEAAWAALSALAPARGTVAGYTGTAVLEEADDDTHTATLRLQGTGPEGFVTATVTATLEPAGAGTRLHFATRAHPRAADAAVIEAVTRVLAAAIAAPEPPRRVPAPPPPPLARSGRRPGSLWSGW